MLFYGWIVDYFVEWIVMWFGKIVEFVDVGFVYFIYDFGGCI